MTTDERPAVPHQTPPPPEGADAAGGGPRPGPSNRRRWLTLVIVVLLIGIPAGYIVVSAAQSRDSGKDKEQRAAAKGLTAGWPSKVTRRIYDVPIPRYSDDVASFEKNSWKTSKLYVQFVTSPRGLNRFLGNLGTRPAALGEGKITVSDEEAAQVGWRIGAGHRSVSSRSVTTRPTTSGDWSGLTVRQPGPEPEVDITVDRSTKAHPKVYVVSTITP